MEMVTFECENDGNTTTDTSYTEVSDTDGSNENTEKKLLLPNSLLTLLDDKNRSIYLLKRQVHNQKLQLSFYLHRVFNSPKIIELAESCIPYETEENIQINLAMNQFCKQEGLKSRIMVLHARMIDIEKRIIRTLEHQEDMIHVIVNKIIEFKTKTADGNTIQVCLSQLKKDCGHVEILTKILAATNKLRKELDTFRTCCNRLMVIEDERNSLVEQVYSLPVTQRMSYSVLLAAQYEKLRLEKEVQEIRQEQQTLQERFASLTKDYSNSDLSQNKTATTEGQVSLNKMLEVVNSEAMSLLESTREQKDKYMEEITKLKEINDEQAKQLVLMQEIVKEKEELENRIELASKEFQKLREYDQNQLKEFNIKLACVSEEKTTLQNKLQYYSNIEEQMKCLRTQVEDMETIRGQRDYYKLQVDDLQAIRAAYAQLVEHCPAKGDEGDNKEQTGKIQMLEKQNQQMSSEIENIGEIVCDQEAQIKHLLVIIEKLAAHRETPKVKRTLYSVETTKNINKRSNTDSGYSSESRSVYSQTDTNTLTTVMKEVQSPRGFISSSLTDMDSDNALKYFENGNKSNFGMQTETICDFVTPEEQFNKSLSDHKRCKSPIAVVHGSSLEKGSFTATTSVEVQSVNTEGKTESLKAILESSSPIEGTIEVNNSSALSLKLTCTPSGKQNTPVSSEEIVASPLRIATPNLDEFELMKDASSETLAATVPSVRQKMVAMECVEYTCHEGKFNSGSPSDDYLNQIAKRNTDVDEIISRETLPQEQLFEDEEDDEEYNPDEEIAEIDYEAINELPEVKGRKVCKVSELTGRLQLITSNLDRTLSQPGGKDSLLSTMRLMYNSFLKDSSKF